MARVENRSNFEAVQFVQAVQYLGARDFVSSVLE
jgi:hypothetical protein